MKVKQVDKIRDDEIRCRSLARRPEAVEFRAARANLQSNKQYYSKDNLYFRATDIQACSVSKCQSTQTKL